MVHTSSGQPSPDREVHAAPRVKQRLNFDINRINGNNDWLGVADHRGLDCWHGYDGKEFNLVHPWRGSTRGIASAIRRQQDVQSRALCMANWKPSQSEFTFRNEER
ncbi:conserved hypothetical protein [Coccidioides posadasii str. Silveira]|uniref:Uncharacterized protein n=1 Tax=Coccidioides posadasii (strain RMSCC 757 / Silveira) TaxID=443226 RepID=E9DI76_COCPS|nr:conserved hypothetical protein [Coccidioides posadasii str. Silveira]